MVNIYLKPLENKVQLSSELIYEYNEMTKIKQVYKCEICGNIVEVLHEGAGALVCCSLPMVLQEEHNQDGGLEKHVPVIEKTDNGILVKIGSIPVSGIEP